MKTKNVVLAFAAIVFAVGSVFASMLTAKTPYARVKFSGDTNFTCRALSGSCEDSGTSACRITINGVDYQANQLVGTACTTPVTNTTGTVVGTLTNANIVEISNTPL